MSKNIYILDPGHGGINPSTGKYVTVGKRSPKWPDGSIYYEGVGNRTIAKLVGDKLKTLNIDHRFTVDPHNWHDDALAVRTARANALHAKEPVVYISIHSNGATTEQAHGYEIFTSPGETKSDKYATAMFQEYAAMFPELKGRKDMSDGDPDKESCFWVLKHTNCPAMLIETMFHSNQAECKMLMDPVIQDKVAQAIVNGILKIEKL